LRVKNAFRAASQHAGSYGEQRKAGEAISWVHADKSRMLNANNPYLRPIFRQAVQASHTIRESLKSPSSILQLHVKGFTPATAAEKTAAVGPPGDVVAVLRRCSVARPVNGT